MKPFDFIAVLLSIVISLAMAHILTGIAHMVQRGIRRFSFPLIYWIGFSMFCCVDYWFSIWGMHDQQSWSFGYVCGLLVLPSLTYLVARLSVPEPPTEGPIDLTGFYDANRRKMMSAFMLVGVAGEATNLTLPGFGSPLLALMVGGHIMLFAAAGLWKPMRVQLAVIVANFILTGAYVATFEPML